MRAGRAHAPVQSASSGGDHGSNARDKGCFIYALFCAPIAEEPRPPLQIAKPKAVTRILLIRFAVKAPLV